MAVTTATFQSSGISPLSRDFLKRILSAKPSTLDPSPVLWIRSLGIGFHLSENLNTRGGGGREGNSGRYKWPLETQATRRQLQNHRQAKKLIFSILFRYLFAQLTRKPTPFSVALFNAQSVCTKEKKSLINKLTREKSWVCRAWQNPGRDLQAI